MRRTAVERAALLRTWARRLDEDGFAGIGDLGLARSGDYAPGELAEALRRAASAIEFDDRFARLVAEF